MSEIDLTDAGILQEYLTYDQLREIVGAKDNRRPVVFFDIETGPGDDALLSDLFDDVDIKLPPYPGEFDESKVKYGNTKKQELRDKKLEDERTKHQALLDTWDADCEEARRKAWHDFVNNAPLHPETCEVIAIGYGVRVGDSVEVCLDIGRERDIIGRFFALVLHIRNRGGKLVSFNGNHFDIPMLTRRAWVIGEQPLYLLTKYRKMEEYCIDALDHWKMGGMWSDAIKLDKLAKLFGVQGKLEGMTGDLFWRTLIDDPARARAYLESDILSLAAISQRMGLA